MNLTFSVQNLPILYYLFFLTPIVLWTNAFKYYNLWVYTITLLRTYKVVSDTIIQVVCYALGCLAMVNNMTYLNTYLKLSVINIDKFFRAYHLPIDGC